MNVKFKIGERVTIVIKGKKYFGTIEVIDNTDKGYRYDIMCFKPEKLLIKHVFEDDPDLD